MEAKHTKITTTTKETYHQNTSLSSNVGSTSGYGTLTNTATITSSSHDKSVSNETKNVKNFEIPSTDNLKPTLIHDEELAHEVLAKAGPAYTYQRRDHSHDIGSILTNTGNTNSATSSFQEYSNVKSTYSIHNNIQETLANVIKINGDKTELTSESGINQDPDPIRIVKPNSQNVVYKQQVNIRYLQPPTPPPPAPIIIREKQLSPPPAQPPIIIRQTAPAPPTPPPLTIRERAPTPPRLLEPTIIEKPIPAPATPRQVIIERVPAPPVKPRPIIYEKWLPYKSTERPVIVQKIKPKNQTPPPKNIIIEYEVPKAVAVRQVIEEGIFKVDPATYEATSHPHGEVRIVDRINDLPIENSRILSQLKKESSSSSKSPLNSEKFYSDFINSTNALKSENPNNFEYETITTTVPESLAEKIIAEARAAGVLSKPSN